jgi:hypothetical protein
MISPRWLFGAVVAEDDAADAGVAAQERAASLSMAKIREQRARAKEIRKFAQRNRPMKYRRRPRPKYRDR